LFNYKHQAENKTRKHKSLHNGQRQLSKDFIVE